MKQVENKATTIPSGQGEGKMFNYADLALACANTPLPQGMRASDIKTRISVVEKLQENSNAEVIEFEDAEFKVLKESVDAMVWAIVHKDIPEFSDYIASIE